MTSRCAALVVIALILALPEAGRAHARSESYSTLDLAADTATLTVTVSTGEVAAIMTASDPKPFAALFAGHGRETIRVLTDDGECRHDEWQTLTSARGFLRIEFDFLCPGAPSGIDYRALQAALPGHVHYLTAIDVTATGGGSLIGEAVLTERASRWERGETRDGFVAFFRLGVEHIAGGIDHIAFLAGLMLVAGSARRSVIAVTGFTLGHSVSLGLAVLGVVAADSRLVESLIGYTVALVAVEYFLPNSKRPAWLVAAVLLAAWTVGALNLATSTGAAATYVGFGIFSAAYLGIAGRVGAQRSRSGYLLLALSGCFGLVHGFGFAGFLLDTGFGDGSVVLPLAGFNLGVEAGQLVLVAIALGMAAALRSTAAARLTPALAAALCATGVYWFVGRSLGG